MGVDMARGVAAVALGPGGVARIEQDGAQDDCALDVADDVAKGQADEG